MYKKAFTLACTLMMLSSSAYAATVERLIQDFSFSFGARSTDVAAFRVSLDLLDNPDDSFDCPANSVLGCNTVVPIDTMGSFRIDETNDPQFLAFVQSLTAPESTFYTVAIATRGTTPGSIGSSNSFGSAFTNGFPADADIDYILLEITRNSSAPRAGVSGFVDFQVDGRFVAVTDIAPVPLPASGILLLMAVGSGLAFSRRISKS